MGTQKFISEIVPFWAVGGWNETETRNTHHIHPPPCKLVVIGLDSIIWAVPSLFSVIPIFHATQRLSLPSTEHSALQGHSSSDPCIWPREGPACKSLERVSAGELGGHAVLCGDISSLLFALKTLGLRKAELKCRNVLLSQGPCRAHLFHNCWM